jgi:predicted kinase
VDPIESAVVRAGIAPSFETGLAAYLVAEACADAFLRDGLDVVIDAVSGVEPARDMWRGLAARHGAALRVIVCSLDAAEVRRRLDRRQRGLAVGEPSDAAMAARAAEWTGWPEPHFAVDSRDAPEDTLRRALAWLVRA